jgi:TRAP-type C4-dicarboxylate transport system permease small subunit
MTLKTFIDVAGWTAALLILSAYALLSFGKMQAHSAVYQVMNIAGAVGFIINCAWNNAWPSVALNVVWLGIGFYALRRNFRATRGTAGQIPPATAPPPS